MSVIIPQDGTDVIGPSGDVVGYILPSSTKTDANGLPVLTIDTTSLSSGHYLNTMRMDEVFDLLVQMITVLQQVAIAQAGQLKFLTAWQQAYTDKMAGVHTFVGKNGDPDYISGSDTDAGTARQDLNNTNTNYTEQMRSFSQIVSDTAKSLQANVSQTQDAVNQQSNMATSIIQLLNTLLASINRAS